MVLSAAPVVISKGSLRVNADDGIGSDSDDEPIVRPSTAAPGARATVVTTSTTENDNAEKPSSAPSSTAAAAPDNKRKRGRPSFGPCPHGVRPRSKCKTCGACPHGRRPRQCKDCGGAGICVHGRVKYYCADRGGARGGDDPDAARRHE